MEIKKCSKCNEPKELIEFSKDSKSKDGKQSQCKKCKSASICDYYKKNPEKRVKRSKEECLKRYYKNRVNMNFSRRMRKSLNGLKDCRSWESLVGYTLFDLKSHLEKQFKIGMTWDNYGEWEIDHVKPIAKFIITNTDDAEFKECWGLDNIQPLWRLENLNKGDKYLVD